MLPDLFDPARVQEVAGSPLPPLDPSLADLEACLTRLSETGETHLELDPELDPAVENALFDAGLFSLTVPRSFGGLGASVLDFARLMVAVGRLGPEWAITAVPHLCISVATVAQLAPPDVAEPIFTHNREAHRLLAFAITEEAGSDVTAMRTRIIGDGTSRMLLRGSKQWVTNLRRASHVVVAALCPELHPRPGAAALVLVPADASGVHPTRPWQKLCANGSDTSDLTLDDVAIRTEWLLGQPGDALKHFNALVLPGRLGASAAAVGLARQGLDCGECEGSAELRALLDGALASVYWAAALLDAGHPWSPHAVGLAKGLVGEVAQEVAERLDRAWQRSGRPSPLALQRARAALGLFRLLKGPGDLLALQSAAALTSRVAGPVKGSASLPESLRRAVLAFTATVSDLQREPQGRSQLVLMALGQAAGWLQVLAAVSPAADTTLFECRLRQALERARRLGGSDLLQKVDSWYTACFESNHGIV